jgi:hypothetical protein
MSQIPHIAPGAHGKRRISHRFTQRLTPLILLLALTVAGMIGSVVLGFALWHAPTKYDPLERMYHTWAVVAESWVALGSVGLVLFFLWEGRHFIKTLASTNYSHIYNRLDQINLLLVQHVNDRNLDLREDVAADYGFPFTDARTHLCDMIFTLYEEAFYQWLKFETLDEEDWEQWRNSLSRIFQLPYVRNYWDGFQEKTYPLKFQQLVREVRGNIAESSARQPSDDDAASRWLTSSWGLGRHPQS